MKNHNTIVNTENCLFYGLPGIVILAVSLMASTRIGADFGGDTFVKTVSFLGCNGLLWLLYLVLCQYLLADLLAICLPKKKTATVGVLEAKPEAGMTLSETVAEQPTTPTPVLSQEQYQSYCADFERQKQEAREELATSVLGYVNRKMAPLKWSRIELVVFLHISTTFEVMVSLKHKFQQSHSHSHLISNVVAPASPTVLLSQNNPDKYGPFLPSNRRN